MSQRSPISTRNGGKRDPKTPGPARAPKKAPLNAATYNALPTHQHDFTSNLDFPTVPREKFKFENKFLSAIFMMMLSEAKMIGKQEFRKLNVITAEFYVNPYPKQCLFLQPRIFTAVHSYHHLFSPICYSHRTLLLTTTHSHPPSPKRAFRPSHRPW